MDPQRFSPWHAWQQRQLLDRLHLPGIYALAISKTSLAGNGFSWLKEIAYFGMTNSLSGLRGRLRQFDSAINGGPGHGGGERFLFDFQVPGTLQPNLYVAVLPFECNVKSIEHADLLAMGDVARSEFECLAEFSSRYQRLPTYNDKKVSPKFKAG